MLLQRDQYCSFFHLCWWDINYRTNIVLWNSMHAKVPINTFCRKYISLFYLLRTSIAWLYQYILFCSLRKINISPLKLIRIAIFRALFFSRIQLYWYLESTLCIAGTADLSLAWNQLTQPAVHLSAGPEHSEFVKVWQVGF